MNAPAADLAPAVAALGEVHYPENVPTRGTYHGGGARTERCATCPARWPCPTERAVRAAGRRHHTPVELAAAVRALHHPDPASPDPFAPTDPTCPECTRPWPCPTEHALREEDL